MPPANVPPAGHNNHTAQPEPLRMILMGSPWAILATIKTLHHLHYAEPNDWSKLQPTDQPGKMMAILTKKMVRETL